MKNNIYFEKNILAKEIITLLEELKGDYVISFEKNYFHSKNKIIFFYQWYYSEKQLYFPEDILLHNITNNLSQEDELTAENSLFLEKFFLQFSSKKLLVICPLVPSPMEKLIITNLTDNNKDNILVAFNKNIYNNSFYYEHTIKVVKPEIKTVIVNKVLSINNIYEIILRNNNSKIISSKFEEQTLTNLIRFNKYNLWDCLLDIISITNRRFALYELLKIISFLGKGLEDIYKLSSFVNLSFDNIHSIILFLNSIINYNPPIFHSLLKIKTYKYIKSQMIHLLYIIKNHLDSSLLEEWDLVRKFLLRNSFNLSLNKYNLLYGLLGPSRFVSPNDIFSISSNNIIIPLDLIDEEHIVSFISHAISISNNVKVVASEEVLEIYKRILDSNFNVYYNEYDSYSNLLPEIENNCSFNLENKYFYPLKSTRSSISFSLFLKYKDTEDINYIKYYNKILGYQNYLFLIWRKLVRNYLQFLIEPQSDSNNINLSSLEFFSNIFSCIKNLITENNIHIGETFIIDYNACKISLSYDLKVETDNTVKFLKFSLPSHLNTQKKELSSVLWIVSSEEKYLHKDCKGVLMVWTGVAWKEYPVEMTGIYIDSIKKTMLNTKLS